MRKTKTLFQIALESEKPDPSTLEDGWQDTLCALIEDGPLWSGDIPSKEAFDQLCRDGYATRIIANGEEPEKSAAATFKGRDLYVRMVFGTDEGHTLAEAIEENKNLKAKRAEQIQENTLIEEQGIDPSLTLDNVK